MYCKVNNNFGSYNKYYAKDEKFNHKANMSKDMRTVQNVFLQLQSAFFMMMRKELLFMS